MSDGQATECVATHEWDHLPGRCEHPHRDARDRRGQDVDILKEVELPGLMLTLGALDREDTHQHRLRVAHDLVVDEIRVD